MLNTAGAVKGREGAVLAITLVLAIVLFILSSGLFIIFNANVDSYEYTSGRLRAITAAESGVNLALYKLAEQHGGVPADTDPYSLPGDSAHWIDLPGMEEKVWVVVDPFDGSSIPYAIGGAEIRCRGFYRGYTRDVRVRVSPDYPSRYAYLVNGVFPSELMRDGSIIDGPVHANGTVEFASTTPDSSMDPFVASVSTGMDEFYFTDAGYSDSPHPQGSSVWVRPYSRHIQGKPYWEAGADSLDFDFMREWFSGLRGQASISGEVITATQRILIEDDMLLTRNSIDGPVDTIMTEGKDLFWVMGGARPVFIKGVNAPKQVFTLICSGDVYISGSIQAPNNPDAGLISIVSLRNIVIPEDPGSEDWPNPWKIETDRPLQVNCILAAPRGSIKAENPVVPNPSLRFNVRGGTIINEFGLTGIGERGYQVRVAWNPLQATMHPPHFPSMGDWVVSSWEQDPDYGEAVIDDNLF